MGAIFQMSDGTISGNNASSLGGGVYVNSGEISLSGSPAVVDNTGKSVESNIYLKSGKTITLAGRLKDGADVGVRTASAPTSTQTIQLTAAEDGTNYYSTSAQYVSSDAGYYVRANADGYLELSVEEGSGAVYTGLLEDEETGQYLYYTDGVFDSTYTGMAALDGVWYYVASGYVDETYTGMAQNTENGQWYYFTDGQLDWTYSGMAKHPENGQWYYFANGQLDSTYTGIGKHPENGQWYYFTNGLLDWTYTGIGKHPTNGCWYYVADGQLDWTYTGMVKYSNGVWYYVTNGQLDWSFTGIVTTADGTFYFENGTIVWDYDAAA